MTKLNGTPRDLHFMVKAVRWLLLIALLVGLLAASGCLGLAPRDAEENWSTFYTFLLIDAVILGAVIVVVIFFVLRGRHRDAQSASQSQAGASKTTAVDGEPCPRCGAANRWGRRFCGNCGFRL